MQGSGAKQPKGLKVKTISAGCFQESAGIPEIFFREYKGLKYILYLFFNNCICQQKDGPGGSSSDTFCCT